MTTDTKETETKYYKFLRSDLTHHGYTYQLGLNIDPMLFNPSKRYQSGGFYLTTPEHLFKYYEYGSSLGIVSLPPNRDAQIYQEKTECKVDRLILEKIVTREDELLEIFQNITKKYYLEIFRDITKKCDFDTVFSNVCQIAAGHGHLKILKWAREIGCPWNVYTCAYAARSGHLDVLKWARENDCPWNRDTCMYAAQNGHLDVLKWARENGCPWDDYTCASAAEHGHLKILKWARENGCPWDEYTCSNAANNGHLDILKWARENGCPWDRDICLAAVENYHLNALKWAQQNGCQHL